VEPECAIGRFTLHRVDSVCFGTAAYVVSRRAALALIEHQQSLAFPYDHVLCNPYRRPCSRLKVLQVYPAVARQMDRDPAGLHASDVQIQTGTVLAKPFPVSMLHRMAEFWQREIRMGIPKTLRQFLGRTRRSIVPFDMDLQS
jgi:GR25 family glycosyltransferase involved in LPS biosynthesis